LQNSIVIPLDGFHLYRKELDEHGMRFRGAAFTFDLQAFKRKVLQLAERTTLPILFPSFDHA
jgi:pantothenate kinase